MNKTIVAQIQKFDAGLKSQAESLLTKIFNKKVTVSLVDLKVFNLDEIKIAVGDVAFRVDTPVNNEQAFTYLASSTLSGELSQYLEKSGEKIPSMPDSMQLVLDIAEQITILKNKILSPTPAKNIQFSNPSVLLWQGLAEPVFVDAFTTFYKISMEGEDDFNLVRIIPQKLSSSLFSSSRAEQPRVAVHKQQFDELDEDGPAAENILPIEELYDLDLDISVELGRKKMILKDVLDLGVGGIVELDKFAGDNVELFVNEKKFAEGEVVVVEQNYAVRITKLISAKERMVSFYK